MKLNTIAIEILKIVFLYVPLCSDCKAIVTTWNRCIELFCAAGLSVEMHANYSTTTNLNTGRQI